MISLVAAKEYLRVDFDDDDSLITRLITAAGDHLRSMNVDVSADLLPPAIELAALMLVSQFYENREAVSDDVSIHRLIAPFREHSV